MKISKLFYFFNFLFVINLLIPHIRAENDLNLSEGSLIKLEKELEKEKKKKRTYLYILISLIAFNVFMFTFNIARTAYKQRKDMLQAEREKSLYDPYRTTSPYIPTPAFPAPKISPSQKLQQEFVDQLVKEYDGYSSNEKTARLKALRKQNGLDPSRPYKGITEGREEARALAYMLASNIVSGTSQ